MTLYLQLYSANAVHQHEIQTLPLFSSKHNKQQANP